MADYFSQTVIRPDIPRTAMTELEFAVLALVFDHEMVGEDVYFRSSSGPSDIVTLPVSDVRRWLLEDEGVASGMADLALKELAELDPDAFDIDFDLSMIGFEGLLQDVVKRSALDFIEVETAWTCSKMRPDGFGGAATLITADAIESLSTAGWLDEAIVRAMQGPGTG